MNLYKNEVEKPALPAEGRMEKGMGLGGFFEQCDPIAYGQASEQGCRKDEGRMKAQFKNYNWD